MRRAPIQAARRNARGFNPALGCSPRALSRPGGTAAQAAGFTLLEAIVAMVVFTMGAFALYGWLATNTITLERIRQRQQIEAATQSALDMIRRSNPMESPEGQRKVGDLMVTWTAKLVEPARTGSSQEGAPTLFAVGLYDVDVRVMHAGRELGAFRVRQAGWKQLYTPEP